MVLNVIQERVERVCLQHVLHVLLEIARVADCRRISRFVIWIDLSALPSRIGCSMSANGTPAPCHCVSGLASLRSNPGCTQDSRVQAPRTPQGSGTERQALLAPYRSDWIDSGSSPTGNEASSHTGHEKSRECRCPRQNIECADLEEY